MTKEQEKKRWAEDPLYRFFTNEIYRLDSEIERTKNALAQLVLKQEENKRGRAKMVGLRRELDKNEAIHG